MKRFYAAISLLIIFFIGCENPDHYKNIETIEIDFSDTSNSLNNYSVLPKSKPLYVAISAMISPKETFIQYKRLLNYISSKLDRKIVLKQRKTYQEINDLLQRGELDFALLCTGAYVIGKNKFPMHLLAVPLVNNEPYYQAYVIAHKNSAIKEFSDFEGRSFAFTDLLSNTGYSYIQRLLAKTNDRLEDFFSKIIFTYAHDYSIQAVSKGIVDGASIDGLIYEYLAKYYPERVEKLKIIRISEKFGIPPFVYSENANIELIKKTRTIMLEMHKSEEGKAILDKILIDKFIIGDNSLY